MIFGKYKNIGWSIFLLLIIFFISSCATYQVHMGKGLNDTPICKGCNIVLISLTNVRADHLGVYGYTRNTSPNLDAFSKSAIIFDNAFTVASWTLPALISIYTSRYPFNHGMMMRSQKALDKKMLTLVDVLNNNGYETAIFSCGKDYLPKYGLTDRFKRSFFLHTDYWQYESIKKVIPKAIKWIRQNRNKKFFIHIQGYDAHCPHAYPKRNDMFDPNYYGNFDFNDLYWTYGKTIPFMKKGKEKYYILRVLRRKEILDNNEKNFLFSSSFVKLTQRDIYHMVALYDGEIYNADKYVGYILRTLKKLKLMNRTIIVFLSEHGEMLGKNGQFMRGMPLEGTFYDDVLHVPLLIYHPHLKPKRIQSLVSLIDLAPTLLDFLTIDIPKDFEGKNVIRAIKEDRLNRRIFFGAEYTPSKEQVLFKRQFRVMGTRDKKWKLIIEHSCGENHNCVSRYELYDINKDSCERNNLSYTNFKQLEDLSGIVNIWFINEIKNKERGKRSLSNESQ